MVPDPEIASSRATARAQHVASQDFTQICHALHPRSTGCCNKWAATTQGDRVRCRGKDYHSGATPKFSVPFPLMSTYICNIYIVVVVACQNKSVANIVAYYKLWLQGDRSRLGLRGSASSEFVPTLFKRDESEVIFPQQEKQEQKGGEVQTESLTVDRLSGGKVSITLERQQQTERRLGGVLVANEQVVGPPCTAR